MGYCYLLLCGPVALFTKDKKMNLHNSTALRLKMCTAVVDSNNPYHLCHMLHEPLSPGAASGAPVV